MSPEEIAEDAIDTLINAEMRVGGSIGQPNPNREGEIIAWLTSRGFIGPNHGLTRKGLTEAKRAHDKYWSEP